MEEQTFHQDAFDAIVLKGSIADRVLKQLHQKPGLAAGHYTGCFANHEYGLVVAYFNREPPYQAKDWGDIMGQDCKRSELHIWLQDGPRSRIPLDELLKALSTRPTSEKDNAH
jgi:hypothetical protein